MRRSIVNENFTLIVSFAETFEVIRLEKRALGRVEIEMINHSTHSCMRF